MEKKNVKKQTLVAASVAGLLAVTGAVFSGTAMAEVACYGANACKGTGACGGKNHSCAGLNACKGQGYVNVDSPEACTALKGTLTPAA